MAKTDVMLTVALAVRNEADNLKRCLSSVKDIADEIVVVDGGSTDATLQTAKEYGATVIRTDNPAMFHINKQKALDASSGLWILQLDADEVVTDTLRDEIREVIQSQDPYDGYYIPRRNYFLGHWMRKGGQYPDYVIRLFKHGKGAFPRKSVHEQIEISGSLGKLKHPLDHYSYVSVKQYWQKSSAYIRLTAKDIPKGNPIILFMTYVIGKPLYTFTSLFVRHKGFVDGWYGFLFALFSALHFPVAYGMRNTREK